jgi:acetyl esterase/lipase
LSAADPDLLLRGRIEKKRDMTSRPADRDLLAAVHPALRSGLNPLLRLMSRRKLTRKSVLSRRWIDRLVERIGARGVPSRLIERTDGSPELRIWVIDHRTRKTTTPTPAVLHLHGGGYVGSSAAFMFGTLKKLSAELDCLVVSVDYRLAPETPFPGSLEDNYAALGWLHANATSLGIDPARIAVMGESAGGGHAAALAIAARDRGAYPLAFQVLIYPMLDDRTGSVRMPSSPAVGAFIWTASSNVLGWTCLLGVAAGGESPPPGSVPARVGDLRGLPPAWIGVGTLDLFHDEDIAYARRLQAAGVPTTLELVPGAYHGFDILMKTAPPSKAFTESWMSTLRNAFRPPA